MTQRPISPLLTTERAQLSASLGESHFREYKSGLHGPPGAKVSRPTTEICRDIGGTLVAFANADGGELLVGVEDSGEISGLIDFDDKTIDTLLNAPKTHVHPDTPLISVMAARTSIDGKAVLYFSIPKSLKAIHLTSDGKCLQRKDLESIPVAPRLMQLDRQETKSREYDREYIDGASLGDLSIAMVQAVAEQISRGMSPEKCLQHLSLADFEPPVGLRLRRAALLLFADRPDRYHPRIQVRILKVNGTELGSGAKYNVVADDIVRGNIFELRELAWEKLRAHLVQTQLAGSARFEVTYIYPELACQEALINAIAHRDYADEGRGVELYVFNDRIEIRNPGGLIAPITVDDLKAMKGAHQSRNSYIARTLREVGYMRELGEGMRRIHDLMKSNELAPPTIDSDGESFSLTLFHRAMYSQDELLWLEQYNNFGLSSEQKAIVLLGRKGNLIAPQDIWDRLGLVDTEHYRRLIYSLQIFGILESARAKGAAQGIAKKQHVPVRSVPRFRIKTAKDVKPKGYSTSVQSTKPPQLRPIRTLPKKAEEGATIFVTNLPENVSDRDMMSAFEQFGVIESVFVPKSGTISRGYGFVEFDSAETAQRILREQPRVRMGPYALRLHPARPRIKR